MPRASGIQRGVGHGAAVRATERGLIMSKKIPDSPDSPGVSSSQFSILLAWHEFEENYIRDDLPLLVKLSIERAFFEGAKFALALNGDSNDKDDITERLDSLAEQIEEEEG